MESAVLVAIIPSFHRASVMVTILPSNDLFEAGVMVHPLRLGGRLGRARMDGRTSEARMCSFMMLVVLLVKHIEKLKKRKKI